MPINDCKSTNGGYCVVGDALEVGAKESPLDSRRMSFFVRLTELKLCTVRSVRWLQSGLAIKNDDHVLGVLSSVGQWV